jgi:hypothetical protein
MKSSIKILKILQIFTNGDVEAKEHSIMIKQLYKVSKIKITLIISKINQEMILKTLIFIQSLNYQDKI